MIPVCTRQSVTHVDEDGIVWQFVCKTGLLEIELFEIVDQLKEASNKSTMQLVSSFLDKILIGWKDPEGRMPEFAGTPSNLFNSDERLKLLEYWHKANTLTSEQKKN